MPGRYLHACCNYCNFAFYIIYVFTPESTCPHDLMHYESRIAEVAAITGPHTAVLRLSDPAGRDACSACAAASLCSLGRRPDTIVADTADTAPAVGDRVEITAPASLTRRAIALLLVLPLAAFVAAAVIATLAGATDALTVAAALAAAAAVYGLLFALRRRIDSRRWRVIRIISHS